MTDEDAKALRVVLQACLLALNDAPSFSLHVAEGNPLQLPLNPRSKRAKSYHLALRVHHVLEMTK